MRNRNHSRVEPIHLASIRHGKDYKHDLRSAVIKLRELSTALTATAEALEFIDIPELEEMTDFYTAVQAFEISLLKRALRRMGGSQRKAAKLLKLKPTTLNSKLKTLNIDAS